MALKINDQIECPECHFKFPLTQALHSDFESAVQVEIGKERAKLQKERELENEKLKSQLEANLRRSIESQFSLAQQDLKNQVEELSEKAKLTEQSQLELLKLRREMEEQKHNQQVQFELKLESERQRLSEEAIKTAQEGTERLIRERDQKLDQIQKALDEANRKLAQGSQQLQGEAFEVKFEEELPELFPDDDFIPVKKGEEGADILQVVKSPSGQTAGKGVIECKEARSWKSIWLKKLRQDQTEAEADFSILITTVFPKEMTKEFDLIEGVWITSPRLADKLILMLRQQVLVAHQSRSANKVTDDQKGKLFSYLTSPRFRQIIENELGTVESLLKELDNEELAMSRIWKKRREQYRSLQFSKAGFYGDLQGALGASLPSIKMLELMSPSGTAEDSIETSAQGSSEVRVAKAAKKSARI
jgi:hypothetical protein